MKHNINDDPWWPTNYFASRSQFIKLGTAAGARMDSYPIAAPGPAAETLTVDVASITSGNDKQLIILTSGVHGVEGFLGAAVQISALKGFIKNGTPARTGIVMIHAANPWGFAHLRRVDENNVDINRNFFARIPISHSRYAALNPIINPSLPPSITGEIKYWFNAIKLIALKRGIKKLFEPIAQGQYDYAKGVFYGGTQIAESTALLKSLIEKHSTDYQRISILDVHSGLGPSAKASLIGNSNIVAEPDRKQWLTNHYGNQIYIDTDSTNAYNASGTFSRWCQGTLADKQYLYLCIEIGTVNPIKLFTALRRENQAHQWANSRTSQYVKTKQRLLSVFSPNSPRWKQESVAEGIAVLMNTSTLPTEYVKTSYQG